MLVSRDLDTGQRVERSTGLRAADAAETRKAQRLADAATAREKATGGGGAGNPAFRAWVPGYMQTHWNQKSDATRKRMLYAWNSLRSFLAEADIIYPTQIHYRHGAEFLAWRKANNVHGLKAGHNTALLELKFLSQLLNEAMRREMIPANPLAHLGIGRAAQKSKPELSDAQIKKLREAAANQPEWMRVAIEISLYTGCRFCECEIPMDDVDFDARTIRLRDAKRNDADPRKFFTVPMHPGLRPTLGRLRDAGAKVTCNLSGDKNGRINRFIRQCGIAASFHSLRVTFVTRCHRGGLSESEAMRLVNHSSQLIHRVYSKLKVEDARAAQAKIPLPSFG
jgi:integrase